MTHDEETTERLPEKVAELERCVAEQEARIAELQAIKEGPGRKRAPAPDADVELAGDRLPLQERRRLDHGVRQRGLPGPDRLPPRRVDPQPGGLPTATIIHPDDRQSVWTQVESALAQRRRYQLEYRIRTADGREKWVWEQGTGVFSEEGPLIALEGFITDITERKQAEEELRKSRVMLQATIESLPFDFFALGPRRPVHDSERHVQSALGRRRRQNPARGLVRTRRSCRVAGQQPAGLSPARGSRPRSP